MTKYKCTKKDLNREFLNRQKEMTEVLNNKGEYTKEEIYFAEILKNALLESDINN